jgi:hypothetical protein
VTVISSAALTFHPSALLAAHKSDPVFVGNQNARPLRYVRTKAEVIQQWLTRVLERMEHYKAEHNVLLN